MDEASEMSPRRRNGVMPPISLAKLSPASISPDLRQTTTPTGPTSSSSAASASTAEGGPLEELSSINQKRRSSSSPIGYIPRLAPQVPASPASRRHPASVTATTPESPFLIQGPSTSSNAAASTPVAVPQGELNRKWRFEASSAAATSTGIANDSTAPLRPRKDTFSTRRPHFALRPLEIAVVPSNTPFGGSVEDGAPSSALPSFWLDHTPGYESIPAPVPSPTWHQRRCNSSPPNSAASASTTWSSPSSVNSRRGHKRNASSWSSNMAGGAASSAVNTPLTPFFMVDHSKPEGTTEAGGSQTNTGSSAPADVPNTLGLTGVGDWRSLGTWQGSGGGK